jgi:hypothetical protein
VRRLLYELILGIPFLVISSPAASQGPVRVDPVITVVHQSDIARGKPFNSKDEWHSDYAGIGVTISVPRFRFEIDVTHGFKRVGGDIPRYGRVPSRVWEQGTVVGIRLYPFGRK